MTERLSAAIEFWKASEAEVVAARARADDALKFYVGVLSALAAWLANSQRTGAVFVFLPLALGIVGAGHLAYLHLRARRLAERAEALATAVREQSGVPDDEWPYASRFKPKHFLELGHPNTGPLFSVITVVFLSAVYAYVLLSLP